MGLFSESLKKVFQNNAPNVVPGNRYARVISVTARKGGVGKTTLAVNLATVLGAEFKKKVLLIDLDPQAHVGRSLQNIIRADSSVSISSLLLEKKHELIEISVPTGLENIYLVKGDAGLAQAENLMNAKIGKEFLLRNALKITKTNFDFIIIDTPPNLGNLTINSLVASDYCIIPMDLSILALQGVSDIVEAIETISDSINHNVDVLGLVINRFDKRLKTTNRQVLDEVKNSFGKAVFNTFIPTNSSIPKSQLSGKPLYYFDEKSAANTSFIELAKEVINRIS